LLRADLHVHTCYSRDCLSPLSKIVEHCLNRGINCVAIADHNTIAGALKLREIAPFKVIIAEEILTTAGEIMGMFLTEEIPRGLSPQETISRIRSQCGLVAIPHPFGRFLFSKNQKLLASDLLSQIDIIEVFNSRTPFRRSTAQAQKLALERKKIASAGSDAHTLSEIGRAYVEMPDFNQAEDFLYSLAQGKICGQKSSLGVHFITTWNKIRKAVARTKA
jgi:predicted metal-dependent phosphoesterase TrpH